MPLKWFQKASNISRTAAVVGMIIWRDAYQKKLWGYDSQRRTSGAMKVTNQTCMKWGVCGNSKNTALRLMEEASELILKGFRLKTDTEVVRWPDSFCDERGAGMWSKIMKLLP